MNTAEKNIKIMVSEVARTLNWHVGDTYSVVKRKSPKDRYKKYLECEQKLKEAKIKVAEELNKN
jgi:hypothetical protein